MFIVWDGTLAIGHDMVDRDHRQLVDIINRLHEAAMLEQRGVEVIGGTLCDLADYTRYHFDREEHLMQQRYYPGFEEHRRRHETLVAQLGDLIYRFECGDMMVTPETMDFLRDWLVNHVKSTDREFGAFLATSV